MRERIPSFDHFWLWVCGLAAFAPLVWCAHHFRDLFFFGDEWDQLDQISVHGFWPWLWGTFGENFAPMFKLVWGSAIFAAGGSYSSLVVLGFVVHAAAVVLLGYWMRHAAFGAVPTALAMVVLALAASNVETLAWTIQLITLLSVCFFLGGGYWYQRCQDVGTWTNRRLAFLAVLVAVSTFSSVRGVLTGTALIATTVYLMGLSLVSRNRPDWNSSVRMLLVCAAPAAISVIVIVLFAPGNHHHLRTAGIIPPLRFAAWYFFLNPFHRLFDVGTGGPYTFGVLGAAKLTVLLLGWRWATPRQRIPLFTVLAYELGNAALLGIGRYHTASEIGLTGAVTSSRYQYTALVGTLPFAAVILSRILSLCSAPGLRAALAAAALMFIPWFAGRNWRPIMTSWAEGRGRHTRYVVFEAKQPPAEHAIPGIDFLSTARAKELVEEYRLH